MLPSQDPTQTSAWKKLTDHYSKQQSVKMKDLFSGDPNRFNEFSITFEHILLDYSKNRITKETMDLLLELAKECKLSEAIKQMFAGEKINMTEDRSVLHIALRNTKNKPITVEEKTLCLM